MTNETTNPAASTTAPAGRPPPRKWPLTVVAVEDLTPNMRRVRFTGEELAAYDYRPAQDIHIYFDGAGPEGQTVRRHYTVRSYDAAAPSLDVDFVLHGDGPGASFGRSVQPGIRIEASGPANRHTPDLTADWQIFAGDETALPAIFGSLEALPAGTTVDVYIEVADPSDQLDVATAADANITWLYRGDLAGEKSSLLFDTITAKPLRPGRGHVFLAGETGRMRELRKALLERGLERDQIFAMGYWRPGRFGGDETIED